MNHLANLLAMDDLMTEPLFPVEAPDGRRDWSEIERQVALFRMMNLAAPTAFGFAIPNAGKRNPALARREGICGGAFDTEWHWACASGGGSAWVELKGYDKRGQAGKLSANQVDWGNRMHRLGHNVACFFDPEAAVAWLRELGAPVRGVRHGA